jgi:hypothetical protein
MAHLWRIRIDSLGFTVIQRTAELPFMFVLVR